MIEKTVARNQESMSEDADSIYLDYKKVQEELKKARLDQEKIRADLENAIERSNVMAVKAEIANIELSQIINTSPDGMYLIYEDFTVKRINAPLLSFLDMSEGEAVGKKCHDLMGCSWCGTPECSLSKLLRGKARIELDVQRTRKDGVQVPFMFTATPFHGIDGAVIGMVARYKDITERKYAENTLKEANERLERLSASDGLTQVANRRCFDQTIEREWNRLKRTKKLLSLIMCDVDFFKLFNDTYGHQGGDDCLRSVAKALSETARRGGDFVARYGGEEFVVVLPETESEGAISVAEKIRLAVEKLSIAHSKSKVAPFVTLSLGVATVIPSDAGTPEFLIKCADNALYQAKSSGRNRVTAWDCHKDIPAQG
jgi:diguanylate cyclase (GGDEF)-like protein/PAS domain S-box-containing protein